VCAVAFGAGKRGSAREMRGRNGRSEAASRDFRPEKTSISPNKIKGFEGK
jgi:hypothetical protein